MELEDYMRTIKSKLAGISMGEISEKDKKPIMDACEDIYIWLAEDKVKGYSMSFY